MKDHPADFQSEHSSKTDNSAHSKKMKPGEYFRQVKAYLRKGKLREAFELLQTAVTHFPNEPILLSYYGYLLAIVDRKYRMGIESCQKSIEILQVKENCDEDTAYPVLYSNLGKAYSAAGKRKDSLDAFSKGLAYDPSNDDIQKVLRSMGVRRNKPPIPFLDRSHPLNKYLGIALYKRKK